MSSPKIVRYGDLPDQFVHMHEAVGDELGSVVSIHGGYWRAKYGLDLHDRISEHLGARGWTVFNVEYRRLEPDGPAVWPEMSSDVLDACALAEARSGPTVAIGHSAGGHLALWAAAQTAANLDAVVALAPVSDLFLADGLELSDHVTQQLLGATAAERPDLYANASPLYLLPFGIPQLIVHGQNDDSVPFDMVPEYVETARALGDDISLIDPKKVDHFNVIDPTHGVWRDIDKWMDTQRRAFDA